MSTRIRKPRLKYQEVIDSSNKPKNGLAKFMLIKRKYHQNILVKRKEDLHKQNKFPFKTNNSAWNPISYLILFFRNDGNGNESQMNFA